MNPFEKLAALGYPHTIPIIPPDAPISEGSSLFKRIGTRQDGRGKTPGIKGSNGNWFSFDWVPHVASQADYARWHDMQAGLGIKTGQGLIAIDADTKDEAAAALIKAEVEATFGKLPIRIGNAPKALYLIRISDSPTPYMRVDFGERDERGVPERVEILTEGRQFVASGIHPKTGKPYTWLAPIPAFEQLPVTDQISLNAFMERLKEKLPQASEIHAAGGKGDHDQDQLKGDPEQVRKAVEAIPNDHTFDTRESYLSIGYAIRAAIPDDEPTAFEIFAEWCDRWTEGSNPRHLIEADWRRMKPPYRRGAQWLFELAEQKSGGNFRIADLWFEEIPEPSNPFAEISLISFNTEAAKKGRFRFKPFAEAAHYDPSLATPYLIKGLLDQGAMSVLYGDSNAGKTFVALDLAYHIAAGRPYGDMKTAQGLVAYIAAEGGGGASKRLAALRKKFPDDDPAAVALALLASPVDLLRPDADLKDLLADMADLPAKPVLVVVDTLSRALAGGDENSSVDMGALVKHLDAIRAATGAHVMVVHHTGKDKAKGARGHSLLRAATDTEIEVADAGKVADVQTGSIGVTKQRDLDKSWGCVFALDVWPLALDEDGQAVTSCTVRVLDDAAVSALDGLRAAEKAAGKGGVGGAGGVGGGIVGVPTDAEREVLDVMGGLEAASKGGGGVGAAVLAGLMDRSDRPVSRDGVRMILARLETKCLLEKVKRGQYVLKKAENDVFKANKANNENVRQRTTTFSESEQSEQSEQPEIFQ